jgi:hypothetical protein
LICPQQESCLNMTLLHLADYLPRSSELSESD